MEKAVLINRFKDISDEVSDYDCVCFGTEFCQWLLPTPGELKRMSDYCNENEMGLVLMTPWVTDSGLDAVNRLVSDYFADAGADRLEISVNDIGVMKMLHEEFADRVTLSAGRLLSNQRRDPRTLPLKDISSESLYEHYRHSSFDYLPVVDFYKSFGVTRMEIDNVLQGIVEPPSGTGVSFSLHYPYNCITVTRNCDFCYELNSWNNKRNCMRNCIGQVLQLKCDEIDEPLYLKGTAIFVKNDSTPLDTAPAIDRLVYSPEVPV